MALRVLLADESSTIKKVMQLALQDFAVEVKSVPVGLDVLSVTKTFKPDIVFADVLLTKRNGYEVCADLKNDSETTSVPVVLMWSGFMELDEAKAAESRADRRLEKPFDADTLRNIVKDLVQKTKANALSEYLTFPTMPDFAENRDSDMPVEPLGDIYAIPEANDFDVPHDEEFSQVPLTATPRQDDSYQDDGDWAHRDLSQLSQPRIEVSGDFEEISFDEIESEPMVMTPPKATPKPAPTVTATPPPTPKANPATTSSNPASAGMALMNAVNAATAAAKKQTPAGTPNQGAPAAENVRTAPVANTSRPTAPAATATAPTSTSATLTTAPSQESVKTQSPVDLSPEMVEKIVREQAREVIESICWKVLPDIAERIVREEIQKILRDADK